MIYKVDLRVGRYYRICLQSQTIDVVKYPTWHRQQFDQLPVELITATNSTEEDFLAEAKKISDQNRSIMNIIRMKRKQRLTPRPMALLT